MTALLPAAYLFLALLLLLQRLAVGAEILDPKECRYVLARCESFAADCRLLLRRYDELAGAPPAHDAQRFPPRSVVSDRLAFNRAFRQHLEARREIDLHLQYELSEAVHETDRLYRLWDLVRDSRTDFYYAPVRRRALLHLREWLGPAAYYRGDLPPCVPAWAFRTAD